MSSFIVMAIGLNIVHAIAINLIYILIKYQAVKQITEIEYQSYSKDNL